MNTAKYFYQTFFVILISISSFLFFKTFLPKKLFSESKIASTNIAVDSLLLEALAEEKIAKTKDTVNFTTIYYEKNNGVTFPKESFENFTGSQYLIPFFEKLMQLEASKKGNVRIAYFGDSMTDGDLIVKDFRTYLQEKFGGRGVGFVNITSESANSRISLEHEFSKNWKTQSYLNKKKPSRAFGVNGHVFFANDTLGATWVRYKANNIKFASELIKPTLFYGSSKNARAKVNFINGDTIVKKLNPINSLNTLTLSENNLKSLKINFKKADSIPFYGVNFDDGNGIHVDNFSSRGNSGLPLGSFDVNLMKAFHQKLDYDLIVLQYGANVLNYGTLDYSWYEKKMTKVVNHLKACFPGVSILVISTADKSTKYNQVMKTDSAVVPLTNAQKRYAIKSESGFVNLYTLMGGNGSMVKWVEAVPAKANKDYTHFNHRGAKEVANLIYSQINEGYEKYKKMKPKNTNKPTNNPVKQIDTSNIIKDSVYDKE